MHAHGCNKPRPGCTQAIYYRHAWKYECPRRTLVNTRPGEWAVIGQDRHFRDRRREYKYVRAVPRGRGQSVRYARGAGPNHSCSHLEQGSAPRGHSRSRALPDPPQAARPNCGGLCCGRAPSRWPPHLNKAVGGACHGQVSPWVSRKLKAAAGAGARAQLQVR